MIRAGIVTASDTRSDGRAVDRATGPLRDELEQHEVMVVDCLLVPDEVDLIEAAIVRLVDVDGVDLVLTTGGTGLGPRDVTPEATRAVIEREVPGIAELLRIESARSTQHAWLSRGLAGTRGRALVVNLPGSPRGAVECARMVLPLASHALAVLRGAGHDHPDDAPTKAAPT
jgi:molybdenum cofactor synthesis domain-containing protein